MAVQATAQWWIRTDGDDNNGGGFDSGISGAGTNYSDQATAQLDLTDLATANAGSTTLTSVTGGFTPAMIGNCVKLRSGTNANNGYYFITAYTNTNTVTIDRACDNGGGGLSGGSGRLGGAWRGIESTLSINAIFLGNSANSPLVAGNQINIRGTGSDDPSTVDYYFTRYREFASGTATALIKVVGYNGRPHISGGSSDLVTFNQLNHWTIENCKFSAGSTVNSFYGIVNGYPVSRTVMVSNCIFDAAGFAVALLHACAVDCIFKNSGSAANIIGVYGQPYNGLVDGCYFDLGSLATSINLTNIPNVLGAVTNNVIIGGSIGIRSTASSASHKQTIQNNVIYNCTTGIDYSGGNYEHLVRYNIISNCTTGIKTKLMTDTSLDNSVWVGKNAFYNNTANYSNYSGNSNDILLTADPFVDAANGDFNLNATNGGGGTLRSTNYTLGG